MTDQDLLTLTAATLTGTRVVADYTDAAGHRTHRTFAPLSCDRQGFLTRCELRNGGWRRFKAERIENVHPVAV